MKLAAIAVLAGLTMATGAFADGPCKAKREAKHNAHKAAHECMMSWAKDGKPTDTDPSEDCTAKVSAFVQSAKDLKACRVENEGKKKK